MRNIQRIYRLHSEIIIIIPFACLALCWARRLLLLLAAECLRLCLWLCVRYRERLETLSLSSSLRYAVRLALSTNQNGFLQYNWEARNHVRFSLCHESDKESVRISQSLKSKLNSVCVLCHIYSTGIIIQH